MAKDVFIALILDWNDDFMAKKWHAYVLNDRPTPIAMALVVSKGYDDNRKTCTMRHSIALMDPKSYAKIELVQDDVLQLDNEFFLTFFADGKLFEKKFLFKKNSIDENLVVNIPLVNKPGILGQ